MGMAERCRVRGLPPPVDKRNRCFGVNGEQATYEPDGSWKLVIAARDPGHPNWLSTAGHRKGVIFFRWFLAKETPETPVATVERS